MKYAYHYNPKTLIYIGRSEVHKIKGYDDYILPQCAVWESVLNNNEELEQCKLDNESKNWFVEPKPVEVTAYHKQTFQQKKFEDKSQLTDEYTLKKPQTQFDEWINENWVTNLSNQHIADYNQVDDTRRSLYSQMCDPLKMEAWDLLEEGKEAEANALKQQAREAKAKIKAENPWPEPPTE